MQVLSVERINKEDYGLVASECNIFIVHIKISNIEMYAETMVQVISDTSWLNKLRPVAKFTFEATSKGTIKKLVDGILKKVRDQVTKDFGEFMVSLSAQDALVESMSHTRVPVAELLKEKISGNPGFDFHSETLTKVALFGEAKYSENINPYTNALTQINDFIEAEKDRQELIILENFISAEAIENAMKGTKCYAAAFSINSSKPADIFENAIRSEHLKSLFSFPELYLVGVEVSD